MSAKLLLATPNPRKSPFSMKSGEIGIIEDLGSYYHGKLVLRTYNALVSLEDPERTWTVNSTQPAFLIQMLPKGTEVLLTAE